MIKIYKINNSLLFDKFFRHISTKKNYYKEKYEARFSEYKIIIVRILEECIDIKVARISVSKKLTMIDKSGLPVSSDFISLYPSAIAQPDSKWFKQKLQKQIV